MITFTFYGGNDYSVESFSKEASGPIAQIYKISEDELFFISVFSEITNKGSDQSSYRTIVKVEADRKYEPLEQAIFEYLKETLKVYTIHFDVQFVYNDSSNTYHYLNESYPEFLDGEDNVYDDDEYDDEDEDYNEDSDENEDVYTGDIFKGHEDELDELERKALDKGFYINNDKKKGN